MTFDVVNTVKNITNYRLGIITDFSLSECSFIEDIMKKYGITQQDVIRICVNRTMSEYIDNPELFNSYEN